MRSEWMKLAGVCVVVVMMFGVLGGCGEQAQETDVDVPMVDEPGAGLEPGETTPGEEPATAAIPDSAETLADVVDSFTMPSSFRMTVDEGGETQTMVMMMDGDQAAKMRMEQEGPDASEVMIMDFAGGQMISYNTGTNEGFRLPISEEEAADAPKPYSDYDEAAKVTGSEEIDGVDCWVLETTTMGQDEGLAQVWIGKKDGLMRQAKQGEEIATLTISDINSVPESEFEVPDDIEISDMSDLGDMPGVPEDGE